MQRSKKLFTNILVVALLIAVLLVSGTLFICNLPVNQTNNEPAKAAETYTSYVSNSTSKYVNESGYYYSKRGYYYYYYRVRFIYDTDYVSSVSYSTSITIESGTDYDDNDDLYPYVAGWCSVNNIQLKPKTGYSFTSGTYTLTYAISSSTSSYPTASTNFRTLKSGISVLSAYSSMLGENWANSDSGETQYVTVDIKISNYSMSFTANSYTLSFNFNGGTGTGSTNTIPVTYDKTISSTMGSYTFPPNPTRNLYTFTGWAISGTYINTNTVWKWAANTTAYAQWSFNGYTLSYSVSGGGGSIVGASSEYAKNTSVTVTASPNDGYDFDYWMLNGSKSTINPLTFTITKNSTLVAYFKAKPNVNVTFDDSTKATLTKTEVGNDLYIVIDPVDNYYIHTIVLDGITFSLEYYNAKLNGAGNAHRVEYTARDSNNIVSFEFKFLFGISNMQVTLVQSEAPTYKNPPTGGASIDGVAVLATDGGEARINGFDATNENSTVHISALAYAGYNFTGWTASDGTDLSAYSISADIPYNVLKGKVITANFTAQSSGNANGQTDDDTSGVI